MNQNNNNRNLLNNIRVELNNLREDLLQQQRNLNEISELTTQCHKKAIEHQQNTSNFCNKLAKYINNAKDKANLNSSK